MMAGVLVTYYRTERWYRSLNIIIYLTLADSRRATYCSLCGLHELTHPFTYLLVTTANAKLVDAALRRAGAASSDCVRKYYC